MDEPFVVLEKKIDQLLILLNRLKKENQELRKKHLEMKTVIDEKDNQLASFKNELEKYRSAQMEVVEIKDRQDRVKNKVEKLIEKLKEFESLD